MADLLSPDRISAAAAVFSAGCALAIPLMLGWIAAANRREDDRRAEAEAMRQLSMQWQDYNLAVAGDTQLAAMVQDDAFQLPVGAAGTRKMTPGEIQKLHSIFFKLTALNQVHFAMYSRSIENRWADDMIRDIGALVFQEGDYAAIALKSRGYSYPFIRQLHELNGKAPPPAPVDYVEEPRRRWWNYKSGRYLAAGLGVVASVTIALTLAALLLHRPQRVDPRCAIIERDITSARPRLTRGTDLFAALGCKPAAPMPTIYMAPTEKIDPK